MGASGEPNAADAAAPPASLERRRAGRPPLVAEVAVSPCPIRAQTSANALMEDSHVRALPAPETA